MTNEGVSRGSAAFIAIAAAIIAIGVYHYAPRLFNTALPNGTQSLVGTILETSGVPTGNDINDLTVFMAPAGTASSASIGDVTQCTATSDSYSFTGIADASAPIAIIAAGTEIDSDGDLISVAGELIIIPNDTTPSTNCSAPDFSDAIVPDPESAYAETLDVDVIPDADIPMLLELGGKNIAHVEIMRGKKYKDYHLTRFQRFHCGKEYQLTSGLADLKPNQLKITPENGAVFKPINISFSSFNLPPKSHVHIKIHLHKA